MPCLRRRADHSGGVKRHEERCKEEVKQVDGPFGIADFLGAGTPASEEDGDEKA